MGFRQPWRVGRGGRWQSFGKLQAGETVWCWLQLLGVLAEAASLLKNGKMVAVPLLPNVSSSLEREL